MGAIGSSLLTEEGKTLVGLASGLVQAIGALLAIYATWRIARRQDEAREQQDRADRAREVAREEALGLAVVFRLLPSLISLRSRFAAIRLVLERDLYWIDWADTHIPHPQLDRVAVAVPGDLSEIADRLHLLTGGPGLAALYAIGQVAVYEGQLKNWREDSVGITPGLVKQFAYQAEEAVNHAFSLAVNYRNEMMARVVSREARSSGH